MTHTNTHTHTRTHTHTHFRTSTRPTSKAMVRRGTSPLAYGKCPLRMHKQTNKQTSKQTNKQTTSNQTARETNSQRNKQQEKQTARETNTQTNKQTNTNPPKLATARASSTLLTDKRSDGQPRKTTSCRRNVRKVPKIVLRLLKTCDPVCLVQTPFRASGPNYKKKEDIGFGLSEKTGKSPKNRKNAGGPKWGLYQANGIATQSSFKPLQTQIFDAFWTFFAHVVSASIW